MTATLSREPDALEDVEVTRAEVMLKRALGPEVEALMADPEITDVIIRPKRVWVDRLGVGLEPTEVVVPVGRIVAAIRLAAKLEPGRTVNAEDPQVECDLSFCQGRFAGTLAGTESFVTIRLFRLRKAVLEEYATNGGTEEGSIRALCGVLESGRSVVINGPTGSGKTTFLRACIGHVVRVRPNTHVYTIEDSAELKYGLDAPLHTADTTLTKRKSMRDCARHALRHRPDLVVFGEVRGPEAQDVVDMTLAGHQTMFTIHAHSAKGALNRIVGCAGQAVVNVDRDRIAEALDVVVSVRRKIVDGRSVFYIHEMLRVREWDGNRFVTDSLLEKVA